MKNKSYLIYIYSLLATFLFTSSCRHLDQVGPYQGDQFLYTIDGLIIASHTTVHTFLQWEYNNRDVLFKQNPDINKYADKIRIDYPPLFRILMLARDSYNSNPSINNRDALNRHLSELQQLVLEIIKLQSL